MAPAPQLPIDKSHEGIVRLVVADDNPVVGKLISSYLQSEKRYRVLGVVTSARELYKVFERETPDILLTDVEMPEAGGMDIAQRVKAMYPDVRIIALTAHDEPDYVLGMLKAGAAGYILKASRKEELIGCIDRVMDGKFFYSNKAVAAIERYLLNSDDSTGSAQKSEEDTLLELLTPREKEVLHLIGNQMTTAEIADKLFLSVYTVETHRKRIVAKLGVKNVAGLVKFASKLGL